MPQDDVASQWKSFDDTKRTRLLAKMSPEQKKNLRSAIEQSGVSAPEPKDQPATFMGMVNKARSYLDEKMTPGSEEGVTNKIKAAVKGAVAPIVQSFNHPIDTVAGMGTMTEAVGTPYGAPAFAPTGNQARDEANMRAQDDATAQVEAGGVEAARHPIYSAAGVVAPLVVGEAVKAARTPARLKAMVRGMANVGPDDLKNIVTKEADAAAAKSDAVKKNNADLDTQRMRKAEVQQDLDQKTQALRDKHSAVQKDAYEKNKKQWNDTFEKIGNDPIDPAGVHGLVDQVSKGMSPEGASQFKAEVNRPGQMSQGEISERTGKGAPDETAEDTHTGEAYDRMDPAWQGSVDKMTGTLDQLEGHAGNEPLTPLKLQNMITELGHKIYRGGEMPGNVKHGLVQLRQSLSDMLMNVAKEKGADQDLIAARKSHQDYSEAFSKPRSQPMTAAMKAERDANPAAYKARQQAEAVAKVAKHDPSYTDAHTAVQDANKKLSEFPSDKAVRNSLQEPPDRPVVDIHKTIEDRIHAAAARWRQTSQYQWRRLGTSAIGGLVAAVSGHDVEHGAAAGYVASEFVPKALAHLVEKPKVIEWLANSSIGDINALRTLPNADKIRIVGELTQTAVEEAKAGRPVKIDPNLVHFLGPKNMAIIAAATRPQTVEELKKKAQALQK